MAVTGFFTDSTVCIGCKACEVACKEWNAVPGDGFTWTGTSYDNTGSLGHSTYRHVKFVEQLRGGSPSWDFSSDVCNGCGYCVVSCPFGVIDRRPDDGRAFKCTFCYDRQKSGLTPACAKVCPTESIQFGDLDELRRRAADRVVELHARGMDDAVVYDPQHTSVGGTHAIFLVRGNPAAFNLPGDPEAPVHLAGVAWRGAALAAMAMTAIVAGAFLFA
jgi:formate dehydrogenase iron-sulfur subunit